MANENVQLVGKRVPLDINRTAVIFALLLGGMHLSWAAVVASGFAQPLVDFIFRLHFIKPAWVIEPFSVGKAVALVALTGAIGYLLGAVFAFLWNRLSR